VTWTDRTVLWRDGLFALGALHEGNFLFGQAVQGIDVAVELSLQRGRLRLRISLLGSEDILDESDDVFT